MRNPQLGEMHIQHRHPAPVTVTSACVLSVHEAIRAGYWQAWDALDAEAAEASRKDIWRADTDFAQPVDLARARNRWHPEVLSAVHAGWEAVVAWLRAAEVGQYVEYGDRDTLAGLIRQQKEPLPLGLSPPRPAATHQEQ